MEMRIHKLGIVGLLLLAAAVPAAAQDHPLALDDLSFMLGHWKGEGGEYAPEEIWLEPAAGVMPGFFRWPQADGPYVLEALTFVEGEGGITFYFKHMDPQITAWEKAHANTYRVEAVADDCLTMQLVSESPGVPAGIRYCRLGEDTLQFTGIAEGEAYADAEFVLTLTRIAAK